MIASLLKALRQPEYVHVLINPLPVYGLLIATLGLVFGLVLRSRGAQMVTLLLIILCGLVAWPVAHFGEAAYDNALSLSDAQGQAWLKVHAERADKFIRYFYALAVIALAALILPVRWPKSALPLIILALLFSIVVLGMGAYVAYAGGRIRHGEFRREPAPAASALEGDG